MHSDAFDVIPYEDIKGNWKKLGSGSFGNVYKGTYLGIDVAIKEVLPSTEYDVAKYFEREWRLMKEARHPNVVLYLGLSRAPDPDGRIFIISEFIENGNLRNYIYDKNKPMPWRLRLSFATDIARALAYLHARKCIHRDLKGENLLVTANGRLKITDFGFARIAARNEEESKRLTFCGTDSYMSPEILMGNEFDLPTDIFSLGIIFCEIAARKLASEHTFKRHAPSFTIDPAELRKLASPGCPPAFVQLALDCCAEEPHDRPTTRLILERLRDIEAEVLARPSEADDNIGSVKFMTGMRRPGAAPRIPSFGVGVGRDIKHAADSSAASADTHSSDGEDSDSELMEALSRLSTQGVHSVWSDAAVDHAEDSDRPLLDSTSSVHSEYSTTVIRSHPVSHSAEPSSLSSILTIRPAQHPNGSDDLAAHPRAVGAHGPTPTDSLITIDSFHTAGSLSGFAPDAEDDVSIAAATEGSTFAVRTSSVVPLVHRFTLLRPGGRRASASTGGVPTNEPRSGTASPTRGEAAGWSPLDFLFSSTLLGSKCDVCAKRLGWKPLLECDDCGMRAHIKCGEVAPLDCGVRPSRAGAFADAHRARSLSPPAKDKGRHRKSLGAPAK
ncbi:kinase-like protein [Phanerochaete sordida]|uniref:Kinase-like protein n=1 Tax=Phanerochaete sordida TaxID=48140 RepID=A0A9P3GR94_9APHY|nr:kinase-like protein [Phanerochaete sordida]